MTDSERILTELEDWKRCGYAEMFPFYYPILDDVIELLKEQPQIVRCKDCESFWQEEVVDHVTGERKIAICCGKGNRLKSREWFCGSGKQRGGEQNA